MFARAEDRIADIAESVARTDPARAEVHLGRARRAREFSAHERDQQQLWATRATTRDQRR